MERDITQTTTVDLTGIPLFSVDTQATDGVMDQKESIWDNERWSQYLGYYKEIPEYKTAINAFATWVVGKGWTASPRDSVILESITGWGEDSFLSVLWNMLIVKKFAGDAFAHIIRDDQGRLNNLKPLDAGSIRIVVNSDGIIIRYEQLSKLGDKKAVKKFTPDKILHFSNDRVADEIHGTSITESIEWVILARNEAMRDWKRISHLSSIRIMYVDVNDKARLAELKTEYKKGIQDGSVMVITGKKEDVGFEDLVLPPAESFLAWIRYLEDVFYKSLGVPKIILGGGSFPEGDSKISYLTFEQVYVREVESLKADLWNQLAIRVDFSPPVSLKDQAKETEQKNSSQTGFQNNDTEAGVGQ